MKSLTPNRDMKNFLLVFGLLFFVVLGSSAQNVYTEKADRLFESKNFYEGIDLYKKAYTKEKNKAAKTEILFKIGDCYRSIADTKNAEAWFQKTIKANYKNPLVYLYYAEALKANGLYADAIVQFNKFKTENPSDPRGEEGAKSCEQAQKWKDKPSRYKVDNFAAVNSKYADLAPSYSGKNYRGMIFTSSREEATGKEYDASWAGEKNTDLFEITSDKKGKWNNPVGLSAPVNTESKEGGSSMDRKYTDLFFTRCEQGKGKVVMCKIYQTKRTGQGTSQTWADPVMMTFCADSATYGQPCLSADGATLWFVSDRDGGLGGRDIWFSEMDKKEKTWKEPVNAGAAVNTPSDELFPFIHADGTLYFSSTGHQAEGNMGGLDIFSAKLQDNKWGDVKNMKAPMNSPNDDYAVIWEDVEKRGYFTSNRDGGKGKDDIYSFIVPPVIFTLQGQVIDVDTKKPLEEAKVELVNVTDGSSISFTTDKAGTYKFSLALNSAYKLNASKKEYLGAKAEETTVGVDDSKDFFRDFALKTTRKEIVLPNIFYDLDQATLRPESNVALDGLVETLKDNPTLVIELGSHTDTRGDDAHNDRLSLARAQSCVDYLATKGIEVGRMAKRGYGERVSRLLQLDEKVIVNGKEFVFLKGSTMNDEFINALKSKDEQEAAHQLNRRTELKVLRDDYVPGSAPDSTQAPVGATLTPEEQAKADSLTKALTTAPQDTATSTSYVPDAPVKVEEKVDTTAKVEAPAPVAEKFYTSVKGDTYATIAKNANITEDDLRAMNPAATGKKPKDGTVLRVVDENVYHTVVKGDSYGKIAKLYSIKMLDLKKLNNIKEEPITNYKKLIIKNNNTPAAK